MCLVLIKILCISFIIVMYDMLMQVLFVVWCWLPLNKLRLKPIFAAVKQAEQKQVTPSMVARVGIIKSCFEERNLVFAEISLAVGAARSQIC